MRKRVSRSFLVCFCEVVGFCEIGSGSVFYSELEERSEREAGRGSKQERGESGRRGPGVEHAIQISKGGFLWIGEFAIVSGRAHWGWMVQQLQLELHTPESSSTDTYICIHPSSPIGAAPISDQMRKQLSSTISQNEHLKSGYHKS